MSDGRMQVDGVVNLTPHAVTIEGLGTVPASGTVARVNMIEDDAGAICEMIAGDPNLVPIVRRRPHGVIGLPDERPGTLLIVSSMVLDYLRQSRSRRRDVCAPDTGPTAIRDDDGRVAAVRRLVVL